MTVLLIAFSGVYFIFILAFIVGLFRLQPVQESTTDPSVSIVIAARNEAWNLPALLDSLVQQDYPTDRLEIIIVDDRSTDDTKTILKSYAKRYSHIHPVWIERLSQEMTPKKYALTQGVEHASGDIILATDGDCRAPKKWVRSMVSALVTGENPPGIVVGFSRMDVAHGTLLEEYQRVDFLAVMAANAGAIGLGWGWSGSGQNLAYRKETFYAIGGFTPVADRISGDDVYLVQAISKHHSVQFNASPDSFITTQPVATWTRFLNQHIRWSSNSKHLLKTDPPFLFFLVSAFLANITLLVGYFTLSIATWLMLVMTKFLLEYLVLMLGSTRFQTKIKSSTVLIWYIAQPLYIPITGLGGLLSRFTWK